MTKIWNTFNSIVDGIGIFWQSYLEFLFECANDENRIKAYSSVMAILMLTAICVFIAALMIFGLLFFVFCISWPIKLAILVIGLVPLLVMRCAKKYKKNESDDDIW